MFCDRALAAASIQVWNGVPNKLTCAGVVKKSETVDDISCVVDGDLVKLLS